MPDPTPAEFGRGYRAFQEHEPRDAIYRVAAFLVNHFWGQPRDMADGIGALLLVWNNAFYRYGSFDFSRLEEVLRANMPMIEGFRARDIQSLAPADEAAIKKLFAAFLDALRIKDGKKKDCRSPVAVAKALHILAPSFMPLWDDKIARGYDCYYNRNPDQKYVAFAYQMQALGRQLQQHVPPDCGRTFLKLIDEYNYAKYTRGWV
ncbi:MAG TPA: hypothetical protein VM487_08310 [Phycisphaerae bacterium]|nr:hypothetical protein [Phycisphaerae bacterium]